MYYSVNIPKSLMVYITPQPSSEPWRILHNPLLAKVYIVQRPGWVIKSSHVSSHLENLRAVTANNMVFTTLNYIIYVVQ